MDADITLEDGEILDEDNEYTPQERPPNYSLMLDPKFPTVEEIESEDDFASSSSETDSDTDNKLTKIKRPKLKLKPTTCHPKKNDIWGSRIREDALSENLVNCDVSTVDRSRNVEQYSIPKKNNKQRTTNKRTWKDRKKSHLRLNKGSKTDSNNCNGITAPRNILDVQTTIEDADDDVAKDIANKLLEKKEGLIRMVVEIAGKAIALELFKETKRIEWSGGLLTMNGTRRRTPGGVYLYLVKKNSNITKEQQLKIFNEERVNYKKKSRAKKKKKLQELKQEIAAARESLPELLIRAQLYTKTIADKDSSPSTSEDNGKNLPPSVTNGHEDSAAITEKYIEDNIQAHERRPLIYNDEELIDN